MASSSKRRMTFQVFVCFRGCDVRYNFLGHLFAALDRTGICTYKDMEDSRKGEQIYNALMKAIEESHLAIIIFPKNFAFSLWCLHELARIMELRTEKKLIVYPVFFKVEPRELRYGIGSYKRGMAMHEKKLGRNSETVKRWNEALKEAGSLTGWELHDGYSEAKLIKDIVKAISELKRFDVFLSFRGRDVRENFVESMNAALVEKGINSFMDRENLVMGEDFPLALKDAIDQSRMYVVVFSKNYAESRWCLKELVQILERKNKRKQQMLPIFYQVEQGEVSEQKQNFEKALDEHEIKYGKRKVKKWREALAEAANMLGRHLRDGSGDDWIPRIVEEIENMMRGSDES